MTATATAGLTRDLVVTHTRALKLPGVARHFEGLARQAQEAHWTYEDYLHEVLSAEQSSRHESVIRQRLREARFPEVKTLDTFDFASAEGVNPAQIQTLARGAWVTTPENLILAGPIGTTTSPSTRWSTSRCASSSSRAGSPSASATSVLRAAP